MEYETDGLFFSLLALCTEVLATIRRKLAINVWCLDYLDGGLDSNPGWVEASAEDKPHALLSTTHAEDLRELWGLDSDKIQALAGAAPECLEFEEAVKSPEFTLDKALAEWKRLSEQQAAFREQYEQELAVSGESSFMAEGDVPGRKKDHTPAIHEWVMRLADHGVLMALNDQI